LTNHQSNKWSEKQIAAAKEYGAVVDIEFPNINPCGCENYIDALVKEYVEKIKSVSCGSSNIAVHIMGEMNFTFALTTALKQSGITCLASTTKRVLTPDGKPVFEFVKFRKY
ncbi:MAG: hypothetical protein LBO62_06580, partial [Endomicrobium sp.]|nr:hypothetical protein [Endomicrobium sp.]